MKKIIFLSILLSLFWGCSDSTSSTKKASFNGIVTLVNDSGDADNNTSNFSDINVELYHKISIDTNVTKSNNSHPQIGVNINQKTAFYHLDEEAVYSTKTNQDGSFEIDSIVPDKYNIVISKSKWGWRYLLDVELKSGENSLSDIIPGNISLFPIRYISGSINKNIEVESFHHLLFTENTNLLPDANLKLKENSVCRIKEDKKINIYCNFEIQGNTKDYAYIYGDDNAEIVFTDINYKSDNSIISNSIFKDFLSVTFYNFNNLKIENCVISDFDEHFSFIESEQIYVQKNTFIDCDNGALNVENSNKVNIQKNLVINNNNAVTCKDIESLNFNNNIITHNTNYGTNIVGSYGSIKNNDFHNNNIDIKITGLIVDNKEKIFIEKNIFSSETAIKHYYNSTSGYIHLRLKIDSNNFFSKNYFIEYRPMFLDENLESNSDYFNGITNIEKIKKYIRNIDSQENPLTKITINNTSNTKNNAGVK